MVICKNFSIPRDCTKRGQIREVLSREKIQNGVIREIKSTEKINEKTLIREILIFLKSETETYIMGFWKHQLV